MGCWNCTSGGDDDGIGDCGGEEKLWDEGVVGLGEEGWLGSAVVCE